MTNCENCIHYEIIKNEASSYCLCSNAFNIKERQKYNPTFRCKHFKDKSKIVGLPCNVGDTVYLIKDNFIEPCEVEGIYFTRRKKYVRVRPFHQEYIGNWSIYYTPSIRSFGKTVFLSYEEAEKVLKGDKK